ncbi:MAG: hypothetical protein EPO06_08765 [Burkholderiaceae bacterium]|nr:MAG: hypothetical protein EPO06_08765 [Burkholderiaceae bacterium]
MKPNSYFYEIFQKTISSQFEALAAEFEAYAKTHRPLEVFLWIDERKKNGQLKDIDLEPHLEEFFWSNW